MRNKSAMSFENWKISTNFAPSFELEQSINQINNCQNERFITKHWQSKRTAYCKAWESRLSGKSRQIIEELPSEGTDSRFP